MVIDLDVDLTSWGHLDELCLLACQAYNYGSGNDWFGAFRGGWYGMRMRVWGFQRHYSESHNWIPRHGLRLEHEYHLSTMLFQMDSSIECMVYAANGLGNAFAVADFYDVANRAALKKIAPNNVLEPPPKGRAGYDKHLPRFTRVLRQHQLMVHVIMENHDVSKHRRLNMPGGRMRRDAPEGFYEEHGVTPDEPGAHFLAPMEVMRLVQDPKQPSLEAMAASPRDPFIFERIAELYALFISTAGDELFADARASLKLNESAFRT